jgi:hypothetical protein
MNHQAKRCVVSGKVTHSERILIREHVAKNNTDLSTATRELWLRELGLNRLEEKGAAAKMIELFIATMRVSVDPEDELTPERFECIVNNAIGEQKS